MRWLFCFCLFLFCAAPSCAQEPSPKPSSGYYFVESRIPFEPDSLVTLKLQWEYAENCLGLTADYHDVSWSVANNIIHVTAFGSRSTIAFHAQGSIVLRHDALSYLEFLIAHEAVHAILFLNKQDTDSAHRHPAWTKCPRLS